MRKGFSHIEFLLVLVSLAVLTGGVWVWFNRERTAEGGREVFSYLTGSVAPSPTVLPRVKKTKSVLLGLPDAVSGDAMIDVGTIRIGKASSNDSSFLRFVKPVDAQGDSLSRLIFFYNNLRSPQFDQPPQHIYSYDLKTAKVSHITSDGEGRWFYPPVFNEKQQKLAAVFQIYDPYRGQFVQFNKAHKYLLYVYSFSTGERKIFTLGAREINLSNASPGVVWSNNGEYLAYIMMDDSTGANAAINIISAATGERQEFLLPAGTAYQPYGNLRWSPDDKLIYYVKNSADVGVQTDIYALNIAEKKHKPIVVTKGQNELLPSFSKTDSSKLFFLRYDLAAEQNPFCSTDFNNVLVRKDLNSGKESVYLESKGIRSYLWNKDESKLIFVSLQKEGCRNSIKYINLKTGEVKELAEQADTRYDTTADKTFTYIQLLGWGFDENGVLVLTSTSTASFEEGQLLLIDINTGSRVVVSKNIKDLVAVQTPVTSATP